MTGTASEHVDVGNSGGGAAVMPSADAAPSIAASTGGWGKARGAVMNRVGVSKAFKTLRDMAGADGYIDPATLEPVKPLGEGAFARVESAWHSPPGGGARYMVAVKHLKPELYSDESELTLFASEVDLMRKLSHRNIVGFVGAGEPGAGGAVGAFVEFMGGGTLKRLVYDQMMAGPRAIYTDAAALSMGLQVARGLRYLHNSMPMVIHRDLKLENILLKAARPKDGSWEVKIADFGLSKTVEVHHTALAARRAEPGGPTATAVAAAAAGARDGHELERLWSRRASDFSLASPTGGGARRLRAPSVLPPAAEAPTSFDLTGQTGSLMYMAPEVYLQQPYNEKVDVFSFGLILFELLQKYVMLSAVSIRGTREELEAYAARISQGYRPPIHARWPPAVKSLIEDCWAQDPAARPSMDKVVARLEEIQASGVLGVEAAPAGCACTIC